MSKNVIVLLDKLVFTKHGKHKTVGFCPFDSNLSNDQFTTSFSVVLLSPVCSPFLNFLSGCVQFS